MMNCMCKLEKKIGYNVQPRGKTMKENFAW
jgi:hypothetical protein